MELELLDPIEYDFGNKRWLSKEDRKPLPQIALDPENRHQDLYFVTSGEPFNVSHFETWCYDHGYIDELSLQSYKLKWKQEYAVEGIEQTKNKIRENYLSSVFFDHSTLWSATKALTYPTDKKGKLNSLHILNLATLSQALVLFDHIYCIYPSSDVLSINDEISDNLIKRIPRCSASGLIKIPFDTSQLCCGVVHL